MSDDDRDIDIESDEGDDSDSRSQSAASGRQGSSYGSSQGLGVQAEKRAHHNALERKRRDHIKDSFSSLRDSVPALNGEKVASRAQILKKAADYIQFMRRKNNAHQQDIEDLKRQNSLLESQSKLLDKCGRTQIVQLRTLEKAKGTTGTFGVESNETKETYSKNESESDTSDTETTIQTRRPKKLKVAGYH